MSKPIVYLAGAIAGTNYKDATDWRTEAAAVLKDSYGIKTLDPLRAKESLKECNNGVINKDCLTYATNGPFFSCKGILARDFNDVKRADILLVNLLNLEEISVGTSIELGWAYAYQKPVVVLIEDNKINVHERHPMVAASLGPFRYSNIYDAIDAVHTILGVD